jgi:hypothetical protein
MRTAIICAFVAAATTLVAAPQQTAYRPGDMTRPDVFVTNRGLADAVAVDLRAVNTDTPLHVQVVGTPTSQPVPVRLVRQVWEYKAVVVATREDAANQLRAAGEDGWETTGIAFLNGNQATLLLKRLR